MRLSDYFGPDLHDFVNFIKYSIYGIFVYLNINVDMVHILSILMILDTILGVVKILRLDYQFSMKRLMWGFTTKFLILLIPLVVALIGKGVGKDFVWAVDICIKILIINEGLSCLTNILSAKSKKEIQNVDLVTTLLNFLRKSLLLIAKKIFGESMSDNINEVSENKKIEKNEH